MVIVVDLVIYKMLCDICVLTWNERVCGGLPGTMDGDDLRFEFFGG